jgi:hypothetical protein
MKTPDHTTAQVFPEYIGGEVIADSATLKWPGLFVRRYRFPKIVDSFLVPATAEPLIAAIIAGSAEFDPLGFSNEILLILFQQDCDRHRTIARAGSRLILHAPAVARWLSSFDLRVTQATNITGRLST